jgi:hypothetical protein
MAALDRRLSAALRTIKVDPDGRAAMVGRRAVTAATPALLRSGLTAAIYDELHAGRAPLDLPPGRSLRDPALEESLGELLPHRETIRHTRVLTVGQDAVLVRLDGVKVWVPATEVSTEGRAARAGARVTVRIPAGRPALSPGFFLTDSVRPYPAGEPVVRVYVHVMTVAAALGVWDATLGLLADLGLSYRAKVVSCPGMLPRRDGLVLYLAARDLAVSARIVTVAGRVPGVGPQVSVFAEPVGPGVAIAWEPADGRPGMSGLSFGEHRAAALADGLVRPAARRAHGHRNSSAASVRRAFVEAGIDPGRPARNLDQDPRVRRPAGRSSALGSGRAIADDRH